MDSVVVPMATFRALVELHEVVAGLFGEKDEHGVPTAYICGGDIDDLREAKETVDALSGGDLGKILSYPGSGR